MKKTLLLLFALFFSFNLFAQETAIRGFILVNADTDTDIVEISGGMEINLQQYPNTLFSIRAVAEGEVQSVRLQLQGPVSGAMTENVAPYALFGDVSGDFNGETFLPGSYAIQGIPYDAPNLGGNEGGGLGIYFTIVDEEPQRPFITTWKTDNPGVSDDNQITIPTSVEFEYNYNVEWGDGSSDLGVTDSITHTYLEPGTYQVSISGEFPSINFNNFSNSDIVGDEKKIISVNQWGSNNWTSMKSAFAGCQNLDVVATDVPNLSIVSSISSMFANCDSLIGNDSFNDWDVSSISDFSFSFFGATLFNQNIDRWETSNALLMHAMFGHAASFNQPIGQWDVSNVLQIDAMFVEASSFNQDISLWDLTNITQLPNMFNGAKSFNQDISNWDVSNVTNFGATFARASAFNQDISSWDVSKGRDMNWMFGEATSFDQDLGGWNVASVETMISMFENAVSFDQDISNWDITNVKIMDRMLYGVTLSVENYDSLLNGWSTQQLQNGVSFSAGNSQYCLGEESRQKLIDDFGWVISDGGKAEDCLEPRPFIFSLVKENSFYESITIPINDNENYNYTVNWGDGTIDTNLSGPARHTYVNPTQEYKIEISGDFPRIYFGQLVPIDEFDTTFTIYQWGDQVWTSFEDAFGLETTKMVILAEDAPNLSQAPSFKGMFAYAFDLDGTASMHTWDVSTIEDMSFMFWRSDKFDADITGWDVSSVKNMSHMFSDSKFNQNIADWNVGNVTDMSAMFMRSGINQDIGNWDVSSVTNMSSMFFLTPFNNDIGNWNVENVTDMTSMFSGSGFFNQDISNWNVSKVTSMKEMFFGVEDFDQNLGTWNIGNLENAENFLSDTGLSIENYDATLIGWSNLSPQSGLVFGARGVKYCLGEEARQNLIDDFGWVITDGGKAEDCPDTTSFITTWKTDNPGVSDDNQITIPTHPNEIYNFNVDWGDGTTDSGITGDITHTYDTPGTYRVSIAGEFPRIYQDISGGFNTDSEKILSIDQWGTQVWSSMAFAFAGCTNMDMFALDIPNLSQVESMENMFSYCSSLIGNNTISSWDVSNVNNMSAIFFSNNLFDQDISSWDVSNLIEASGMFAGAESFNQDISSWDVSNVRFMGGMFNGATLFNQNISNWDVSSVTNLNNTFARTNFFNQDLSRWDVAKVITFSGLFSQAIAFNHDLSSWNVSSGASMSLMFSGSGVSNENYDSLLNGWSTQQLRQNVAFDGGNSQYCLGEIARQKLIDDFGWIITDGGKAEACDTQIEGEADLIDATYLEDTRNPAPTGPILRAEQGNRETYLKFDVSGFTGDIAEARLEMVVASDPGWGTLEVFLGNNSNWTETGLNGSNKPSIVGGALASISATHSLGQTKIWNLDVSQIPSGGLLTLILKHSNGNDVAFGSEESNLAPKLFITSRNVPEVQRPFITTWKTDNPGISADNQITIPTFPGEVYDYSVDWGDGTSTTGITSDITHTYVNPGTYRVSISGLFPRIVFGVFGIPDAPNVDTDREKLMSIDQWGTNSWESMEFAFSGCINLDINATDIPNLENVSNARFMFSNCHSLTGNASMNNWITTSFTDTSFMFSSALIFNQNIEQWDTANITDMEEMFSSTQFNRDISTWDTSSVINMQEMFERSFFNQDISNWNVSRVEDMHEMFLASPFNQDISKWDVSKVIDMDGMFVFAVNFNQDLSSWRLTSAKSLAGIFQESGLSNENYDKILISWSELSNLQNGVQFGAQTNQYCLGEAARQKLIDDFGWTISDGGRTADCPDTNSFITTWKTDNPGISEDNQITLTVSDFENRAYTVSWGDGTSDEGIIGNITHTYASVGTYRISIVGSFEGFDFSSESDQLKLVSIDQWGSTEWGDVAPRFEGCSNLDILATDVPDFSKVTTMDRMFMDCISLVGNSSMNNWDVSNVVEMELVFNGATSFNQDISRWNVSSVNDMGQMFSGAVSFNQNLSSWDVSNVRYMHRLFYMATSFNQDISSWNVGNLNFAFSMFEGAISFDQNLAAWNISNLDVADRMFDGTSLSTENYDSLLLGWSSQQLQTGVSFSGGNSTYCLGEVARQKLIDDFGWTITDGGKLADCSPITEGEADLVDATYLEGTRNPEPTGPILRTEKGNRETYLKFDLGDFAGSITEARLEMQVASDPGWGTLEVFLGSNSNWTENGLNGSNKPLVVGNALATVTGTHGIGQTKVWNLDVSSLTGGGEVTLIVKHSNGNDVAFASDESTNPPRLVITSSAVLSAGGVLAAKKVNTLSLSPNPAVSIVQVTFKSPEGEKLSTDVQVYDAIGRMILTVPAEEADMDGNFLLNVQSLESGIYFIKARDQYGMPYQKQMAIKK